MALTRSSYAYNHRTWRVSSPQPNEQKNKVGKPKSKKHKDQRSQSAKQETKAQT